MHRASILRLSTGKCTIVYRFSGVVATATAEMKGAWEMIDRAIPDGVRGVFGRV